MWLSFVAVSTGAVIGANLRWGLSLWLNPRTGELAWGTLAANLVGAWLIGLAVSFFAHGNLSPEWRLFVITGLLGALTTFSTFSLETVTAIQEGRLGVAATGVVLHLGGSLLLTLGGMLSYQWLRAGG